MRWNGRHCGEVVQLLLERMRRFRLDPQSCIIGGAPLSVTLGAVNGFSFPIVKDKTQNMKRYLLFLPVMLAVDWVLGALHVAHIIPLWVFLVFNLPFGLPFVWLESHWTGTQYLLGAGQTVGDGWSLVIWCCGVLAQAWLYSVLYGWWRSRRLPTFAQPEH